MKVNDDIIFIRNISCGSCSSKISELFQDEKDIFDVKINTFLKLVKIRYDSDKISIGKIKQMLNRNGFSSKNDSLDSFFLFLAILLFFMHRFSFFIFNESYLFILFSNFTSILIQGYIFYFISRKGKDLRHYVLLGSFITYISGFLFFFYDINESFSYLTMSNTILCFLLSGKKLEDFVNARNIKKININKMELFQNIDKYEIDEPQKIKEINAININEMEIYQSNKNFEVEDTQNLNEINTMNINEMYLQQYNKKYEVDDTQNLKLIDPINTNEIDLYRNDKKYEIDESQDIKVINATHKSKSENNNNDTNNLQSIKNINAFNKLESFQNIERKESKKVKKVNVHSIKINDIIFIDKNMYVPVDGILLDNNTYTDDSNLTGESLPSYKEKGSLIYAGTINLTKKIKLKVNKIGKDTLKGEILSLIENSYFKGNYKKIKIFAYFIFYYAFIVMMIHYFIFFIGIKPVTIYNSGVDFIVPLKIFICIIIIACPCALTLCEPLSFFLSSNLFIKKGILVNDPLSMKKGIDYVFFDKTGTITNGFKVFKFEIYDYKLELLDIKLEENDILYLLFKIEENIDHPIAICISKYCKEKMNIHTKRIKVRRIEYKYLSGNGIEGIVEIENVEFKYKIIKHRDFYEFYLKNTIISKFEIKEEIKNEIINTINELQNRKILCLLLTGDTKESAEKISKNIGINKYYHNCSSKRKYEIVSEYQKKGKKILMVGDGINDLPALKQANIGVSIKSLTDSTHFTLLNDNIINIVYIIDLSKKVWVRIRLCYFVSMIYNILGILLASGVFLKYKIYVDPEESCFMMFVSSLMILGISYSINYF